MQFNKKQLDLTPLSQSSNLEFNQYHYYNNDCLIDKNLSNIEFRDCYFEECSFLDITFTNCYFIHICFQNCDLSNIHLTSSLFRNVTFINCKLMGTDFSESLFDNVILKDNLCHFANFAFMKNKKVEFKHCDLSHASIVETELKKTKFIECIFHQCEILHSSLYQIDLSTCQLDNIITTPQDIQGAIISEFQASALIHLLKVKVK